MPEALACPSCDGRITAGLSMTDARPTALEPETVVICIHCRAIAIVTEIGTFRKPATEELDELLTRPEVTDGIAMVAEFHRQHGAPKAG